jgi:hypothetical protein
MQPCLPKCNSLRKLRTMRISVLSTGDRLRAGYHGAAPQTQAAPKRLLRACLGFILALYTTDPAIAAADNHSPSAAERMQEPGPETKELMQRAGRWNVVITLRLSPDAKPIVTSGLVAERNMVGQYLEEVLQPAPGSSTPDFRRISFLYYSRVEGRWQYVSMDTRFPVGIMPAWSFEKPTAGKITLEFENLGFVGLGQEVEGRLMHSNYVMTRKSADHEFARQYWTQADGTGRQWLAVQYEYTRAP